MDISFSRATGGRWNQPGAYGVLYLNQTVALARAQAEHKLTGLPYGPEDLEPSEQHDLVEVEVPAGDYLDCVTTGGLAAVGLPKSYPRHPNGSHVEHEQCWAVGAAGRADGRPGVACRSAAHGAPAGDEELAVFGTHAPDVTMTGRVPFADWWWTAA